MTEKLDLITIGESLIEFSSSESLTFAENLQKYYGGDTLCTAIAALRLGAKVGYITKVGMDPFKDYLLDSWQNEGLDISQVKLVNGYNGIYFIALPVDSEKEFSHYRKRTAATYLSVDDIDEDYIKNSKVFYTTGITQSLSLNAKEAVQKAYKIAKENNVLCAYDPNYAQSVWSKQEAKEAFDEIAEYIDILFLNQYRDGEKIFDIESPEKLIRHFWDLGVKTIVVRSAKENGCYTGSDGNIIFDEYKNHEIIDATSTGDAFNGAFLYAITQGMSAFEAIRIALATGSLQAMAVGAIKSIPTYEQVVNKLKEI
ncbi:sugar kinase [bacterium]|nr:sugar kinase [bacterium]